jgi:aspartyl-tRNA synthetase
MLRTHTCGQLRIADVNQTVTLCGWVQVVRDKGGIIYIDLRDRYGITQLILNENSSDTNVIALARTLSREFVIQATGEVIERVSKNDKIQTGDVEIKVSTLEILNPVMLFARTCNCAIKWHSKPVLFLTDKSLLR